MFHAVIDFSFLVYISHWQLRILFISRIINISDKLIKEYFSAPNIFHLLLYTEQHGCVVMPGVV